MWSIDSLKVEEEKEGGREGEEGRQQGERGREKEGGQKHLVSHYLQFCATEMILDRRSKGQ